MYQKILFLFILSLFLLSAGTQVHSQTEVLWSKYGFYEANEVKFSADGNVVLVAQKDKIFLLDTYSGEPVMYNNLSMDSLNSGCYNLSISKDGSVLMGSGIIFCRLWDFNTGELIKTINYDWHVLDAIMTSDAKHIITVHSGYSKNSIKLWNVETGKSIKSAYLKGQGRSLAISDDGRFFAVSEIVGHWSMNLTLWDLQTFTMIKRFPASALYVAINDIAFSPDGKYLAATDENGYIKVWDTETREKIVDILHTDKPDENLFTEQLCFTSDSKYLITCGGYFYDKTTKVWDLPKMDLIHTFEHPYCSFYIFDISSNDSLLAMYFQDYIHIIHNNFLTSSLNINTVTDTLQYPNPVKDIITIELEQELSPQIKIELSDNSGKLVKNFSLDEIMINNTSITLYMAFLSSGSYFLNISTDGFSRTYPFVKL
jgi:WD40 repeat protein